MSLPSENKVAVIHVVQIHMHFRFLRNKKWLTRHIAIPTGNTQALQQSIFRENRLKVFDLHPPPGRLLSFVAQIITCKVRC